MPAALTLHVEYVDRVYLPPDKETGWYQALFSAKYPRQQCEKTFTGLGNCELSVIKMWYGTVPFCNAWRHLFFKEVGNNAAFYQLNWEIFNLFTGE
jgi:hypothetical protein